MKEGAYIGAIAALLAYVMITPIYGDNGAPATIVPTGNAFVNTAAFTGYVTNLPFGIMIFLALEILGISAGIAGQMFLRNTKKL